MKSRPHQLQEPVDVLEVLVGFLDADDVGVGLVQPGHACQSPG